MQVGFVLLSVTLPLLARMAKEAAMCVCCSFEAKLIVWEERIGWRHCEGILRARAWFDVEAEAYFFARCCGAHECSRAEKKDAELRCRL